MTPHHFFSINNLNKLNFTKSGVGFTLVEILVVIGIIGILALITIPALRAFQPSLQLSGAVRELISDLRYTQQLAVTEQKEYCLQFFPVEKKYQIIQCGVAEPVEEKLFPQGIKTITTTGFTNDEVRYNPYGAVREEGTITFENTKDATTTVEVRPSGFVKISE